MKVPIASKEKSYKYSLKITAIVLLALAGITIAAYARIKGHLPLHIQSGAVNGTDVRIKEYLDGQAYIEAKVHAVPLALNIEAGAFNRPVIQLYNKQAFIDVSNSGLSSQGNAQFRLEGDIAKLDEGWCVRGLVSKYRFPQSTPIDYNSEPFYTLLPGEPFYLEILEPEKCPNFN